MRKKLLFMLPCMAAVAFATVVGAKTLRSNEFESNSLLLANVEALADGEEYEYPNGYPYSSTCNVSIGKGRRCKVEIITCQGGGSGCNSKKCPVHPS